MNQLITGLNKQRSHTAAEIRKWRKLCAPKTPKEQRATNALVRSHFPSPLKPTAKNLLEDAKTDLSFGMSRWTNHLDTEYYSACGYDDAQDDARHHARACAKETIEALNELTGQNLTIEDLADVIEAEAELELV